MYTDKIANLTDTQSFGQDRVMRAYDEVHKIA